MPEEQAPTSVKPAATPPQRRPVNDASPGGAERRKNPRFQLPPGFMALIGLPELGGAPFAVSPRDLSRTGLGFYHANELRSGASCTVTLRARDGELVMTHGRIVRRRPMAGRLFDVGVHFDREVDVSRFVEAAPGQAGTSPEAAKAMAQIAQLAGSVRRLAEGQAPLDDVVARVDDLVRLCESTRLPDDDDPVAG